MRKFITRLSIIAGALLAGTSPVAAAQITYTLTGTGSALLGGSFTTGAFSFVGVGQNGPDLDVSAVTTIFLLDSFTLTFGGATVAATNPMYFFHTTTGAAGFIQVRPGNNVGTIGFGTSPVLATYDPATDIGPIPVTFGGSNVTFDTSGGLFFWQGNPTNMTFQAELAGKLNGAVPEPATWGLMIAGFGLAGAALRRKPKVTVSFG